MKTILFAILVTAACGGGGKKQPTTTTEPTPTETTAKQTPTEGPAEMKQQEPVTPPEPPKPDPEQVKKDALAAETTAYEAAKPVFEGFCKGCHVKGQKNAKAKTLGEFEITAYPFTGKHSSTKDIRTALGVDGGKATMPKSKPGSVKGDDLAKITAWADAADAAEAAGAHAKP